MGIQLPEACVIAPSPKCVAVAPCPAGRALSRALREAGDGAAVGVSCLRLWPGGLDGCTFTDGVTAVEPLFGARWDVVGEGE